VREVDCRSGVGQRNFVCLPRKFGGKQTFSHEKESGGMESLWV